MKPERVYSPSLWSAVWDWPTEAPNPITKWSGDNWRAHRRAVVIIEVLKAALILRAVHRRMVSERTVSAPFMNGVPY